MFPLATLRVPSLNPVGLYSLAAVGLVAASFVLLWRPARLARRRRQLVAALVSSIPPLALLALLIPQENVHQDTFVVPLGAYRMAQLPRIREAEAIAAFFTLAAGGYGAGLACMRSGARWLAGLGLSAALAAAGEIVAVAVSAKEVLGLLVPPGRHWPAAIGVCAVLALSLAWALRRSWRERRGLSSPAPVE